jgi:uncharacterized repeat protein (TIGR03803 family)
MNQAKRHRSSVLETLIFGVLTLVVLSALMIAARPAQAQTETVLHGFGGSPDGAYPQSSLTFHGGNYFYGTTSYGGANNFGTVFQLETYPQHTETELYSLCSAQYCADGATPEYSSVIFDQFGNLYGTTSKGGAYGNAGANSFPQSGQMSPVDTNIRSLVATAESACRATEGSDAIIRTAHVIETDQMAAPSRRMVKRFRSSGTK